MRYGSIYAESCLHALTEQLLGALDVRDNLVMCELLCDGGPMIRAVAPTLARGTLIAVDRDLQLANAVAAETERRSRCTVRTAVTDGIQVDLADASCDRITSLLTLGFGDPGSLLGEARRILRPRGGIACVMWDPSDPPTHEAALDAALRDITGRSSPFLEQVLAPLPDFTTFQVTTLRDVVRFDGMSHYWAAMVTERPIATEIDPLNANSVRSLQQHLADALRPSTAADGSMRIPVTALLIRS